MIPFVDLKSQYQEIKSEIDAAIQEVVASCAFVQGKYCTGFENHFAKACNSKFALGCANGTVALELPLRAYNVGPGDEVIVPAHTFIATAEVVSNLGAKVVFADVNEQTYTIDPEDIARKITDKTKVIIPVHIYGQAADMDPILELAKEHNIKVIEDCAQAHFARYKGEVVPVGEVGAFSFYPGKNLGAYGDAGGVVTSDEGLYDAMCQFTNHGRAKGEKYSHSSIGSNYRMDGIQGAVLDVKLKHLPKWTERRREVANMYNKGFAHTSEIIAPIEAEYADHVYHLYVVRTSNRDAVMAQLKEAGVSCGVHYPIPLHLQPAYKHLGYKEGDFPVTEKIAKEILSIPICGNISDESVQKVITSLV